MTSVSTPLSPSDVSTVCCGNTPGHLTGSALYVQQLYILQSGGTRQLGLKVPGPFS